MTRLRKNTVDHFLHDCKLGTTLFILEQKWGNDGYAFWFKLLEMFGDTENHVIRAGNPPVWTYLLAKTRCDEQTATDILDMLADLDAIDKDLWSYNIIWSQNFVDRLSEVYRKRTSETPRKPDIRDEKEVSQSLSAPIRDGYPTSEVKCSEVKCSEVKCSEVKQTMSSKLDPSISEIFTYWQSELNHSKSILDQKRKSAIKKRLQEGYTVERIKEAIEGIQLSPHNMGNNERGTVYDDIEIICRYGANVDRFADMKGDRNGKPKTNFEKRTQGIRDYMQHEGLKPEDLLEGDVCDPDSVPKLTT